MSSSMKRRRRETGVANSRMKVASERKTRREGETPQDGGVDGIAMQTQRRSTTYSRARGQI